jgi:hypothetical protein
MFESRGLQDIIYTQLDPGNGDVVTRVTGGGVVKNWNTILKELLPAYKNDPRRLFHDLRDALRGHPRNESLEEAAGVMLCDVKHDITTWIDLLSELYQMLPRSPTEPGSKKLEALFPEWYLFIKDRYQPPREPEWSYRSEPGRVKTFEWDIPTLIPQRGGLSSASSSMGRLSHALIRSRGSWASSCWGRPRRHRTSWGRGTSQ